VSKRSLYRSYRITISLRSQTLLAFHIKWKNGMTNLKVLSAALIAAALLATPAMAQASQVTSRHRVEDANASIIPGTRFLGEGDGLRGNHFGVGGRTPSGGYGVSGLHGGSREHGSRDVWGHWGAYYGPMIPAI
jgi:hypothetical protein